MLLLEKVEQNLTSLLEKSGAKSQFTLEKVDF
jgi:hypothetical protein